MEKEEFTVNYRRYYMDYTEDFETLSEAYRFVESQEDQGNIFAISISKGGKVIKKLHEDMIDHEDAS